MKTIDLNTVNVAGGGVGRFLLELAASEAITGAADWAWDNRGEAFAAHGRAAEAHFEVTGTGLYSGGKF